jgi:hypothetical protein
VRGSEDSEFRKLFQSFAPGRRKGTKGGFLFFFIVWEVAFI